MSFDQSPRLMLFGSLIICDFSDAMTGTLEKMNIVGRNGLTLKEAWHAGYCRWSMISLSTPWLTLPISKPG